jgi:hypothetical protein
LANAWRSFRRDHTNGGTAPNQALDFGFGYRPAADDKTLASCQLQKQGK